MTIYNRYSYCWNNPLKFVDPSGYYTIDIDGLQIQAHSLGYLAGVFGNDNVESIYSRGYDNKPIQFREVVNSYTYYDPIPKYLGSGESINDYRHTVTNRYYYAMMGLDGDENIQNINFYNNSDLNPPKIDFSKNSYIDQIQSLFYWIVVNGHSRKNIKIDEVVDFSSLDNSKYFDRYYSQTNTGYRSKTEPVVSIQDPGTILIPEVSIRNASKITITYNYSTHPPTVVYGGLATGYIYMFVPSQSTENWDSRRDVGITIRFNTADSEQFSLFMEINNSIGGAYVCTW